MVDVPKNKLLSYESELYKELYEMEEIHRNQISSKFGQIIAIYLALFPAAVWSIHDFVNNYNCRNNMKNILIFISILFLCASMACSCYHLVRGIITYDYVRINPNKIRDMVNNCKSLEEYYNEEEIISAIKENIRDGYINASSSNYNNTLNATYRINYTFKFILISVISLVFCFAIIELF